MQNRTIFIGNGFDLSIGMPTKYIDFAQSSYWPQNTYGSRLAKRLEDVIKDSPKWFDIESLTDEYAKEQDGSDSAMIEADRTFFNAMKNGLMQYLSSVERPSNCAHISPALDFLEAVSHNADFKNIYTFNYTSLEAIAQCKGIKLDPNIFHIRHLHGSLKNRAITLGTTDEAIFSNGYDFLIKSFDESYAVRDVAETLTQSKEVVFFGVSLGRIDIEYFKDFFVSISNGKYTGPQKKSITILTYDNKSRMSIMGNLHAAGISVQKLQMHSDFKVLYTDYSINSDDYHKYLKQIQQENAWVCMPLRPSFESW